VPRDEPRPPEDGPAQADTDAVADSTDGPAPSAADPPTTLPIAAVDERRRRQLRRWAIGSGVLVALVTGGVALSYTSVFAARLVEVQGEVRIGPRRVLRIAGVDEGTNVIHLDESLIETRLEEEPWIREATVRAELPTTIRIEIHERTAVLVVAAGGTRRLVADDGTVLSPAPQAIALPEFVAPPGTTPSRTALRSAAEVTGAMALPLRTRVSRVSVDDDGEVSLAIDGDVSVRFGTSREAGAKAQALRAILAYARRAGETVLTVDVSAPAAATATFEGSYRPATGPDPSADVAARPESSRPDGGDPSVSSSP
jgi:cell division protein FtsQ